MQQYRHSPSTRSTTETTTITPIVELPRQKHLNTFERDAIVVLYKDGQSKSMVANKIVTSLPTIRHWIQHYEETKNVKNEKRSGRKRKTTEEEDWNIYRAADDIKFTGGKQIKHELDLQLSRATINRRLQEVGLNGCIARKKRNYNEREIMLRLSFANGYKDWTCEQWDTVIFSDEKIFNCGFNGQYYVRRPIGEALNPDYMIDKKPHPIKVNVWACFSGRGLGYIYIFNETLDAKLLKQILNENLIPSARLLYEQNPPELWWYQHDNDKKFTGSIVSKWIHDHGIHVIEFPPYSPDCNIMENLWIELEKRVEKHNATTLDELQNAIAHEWNQTSLNFLQTLSYSMPKRCQAVIDANGQHTTY